MNDDSSDRPSAHLVARLRAATGVAVVDGQRILAMLPENERERVVNEYERGRKFFPWFRPVDNPEQISDTSGWRVF